MKSTRRREPMRLLGPRWSHSSSVIIILTGNLLGSGTKSTRRREPMRLLGPRSATEAQSLYYIQVTYSGAV